MVQFLLQKGYIKPDQVDQATKVAQQTGESDLGKVLVGLGFVGEREVIQARAQEQGIAFADLDRVQIDSSALNIVPERLVRAHSAIPVKKDGQNLYVAMANTSNIAALDDIRMVSRLPRYPSAGRAAAPSKTRFARTTRPALSQPITPRRPQSPLAANGMNHHIPRKAEISRIVADAGVRQGREDDDGSDDAEKMAEQAPIIKLANALIQQAIIDRASDIHVEPQQRSVRCPVSRLTAFLSRR